MPTYHETITRFDAVAAIDEFLRPSQEQPGSFEDFERGLAERMRAVENDIKAEQLVR